MTTALLRWNKDGNRVFYAASFKQASGWAGVWEIRRVPATEPETRAPPGLGVIKCRTAAPFFPSQKMPLFDFSMVGMGRGDAEMHYIRVEGVAADGVASVGLLDRSGATVERLPVHGNISGAESLPTRDGVRLVALDASGNVLGDTVPSP